MHRPTPNEGEHAQLIVVSAAGDRKLTNQRYLWKVRAKCSTNQQRTRYHGVKQLRVCLNTIESENRNDNKQSADWSLVRTCSPSFFRFRENERSTTQCQNKKRFKPVDHCPYLPTIILRSACFFSRWFCPSSWGTNSDQVPPSKIHFPYVTL